MHPPACLGQGFVHSARTRVRDAAPNFCCLIGGNGFYRAHRGSLHLIQLPSTGRDDLIPWSARSRVRYVYRGNVKYTDYAFNKTTIYKRKMRNHLVDQIENFRVGDKDGKRDDDLLDTFCYGIAVALGNEKGF